jgi:hypothetical protein
MIKTNGKTIINEFEYFDDKPAPKDEIHLVTAYLGNHQPISNLLVKKSTSSSSTDDYEYNYSYRFNDKGYPTITQTELYFTNHIDNSYSSSSIEYFTYECR